MSHTGYKYQIRKSYLGETGFIEERPTSAVVEQISKDAILDSHVLEGEFQGNGVVVLTGLSTSQTFDVNNILNDNEKGVLIGYVPDSPYFQLFRNDGTGSKVVYQFPDKYKDDGFHVFNLVINPGKLSVELDGADTDFTTKIPSINDTYYVVNYSIY